MAGVGVEGLPPDPSVIREHCDFMERCPHACEKCKKFNNHMIEMTPGHMVRCWKANEEV